ncbi:MAG: YiiX/YebB-like N1pC/P60 family cysteine hydrolase [Candidatus Binataceae bacterium]
MTLAQLNPVSFVLRRLTAFVIRLLTKPLAQYQINFPNEMVSLKRHIRKGDVLLVEGNERVSECIKYLTQSSWSHSALYVGDDALKYSPEWKERLLAEYGEEASYMVVEALVEEGVVLTPLSKYRDFNIRLCHPCNLTAADQAVVVQHALEQVGDSYDLKNIVDLMRYFLPVSLVPARLRRKALQFGSGDPTRVICSSLIADCFCLVRFPIVPQFEPFPPGFNDGQGRMRLLRRFSRVNLGPGLLKMVPPTLITPRDFDLSPYFAIVKFNVIENAQFDYHKLLWVEEAPAVAPPAPPTLEKSA